MPRITGLAHTWGTLRLPDASKKEKADDTEAFTPAASLVVLGLPRPPLPFSVDTVLAPMVNQCDVPFRRLCVAFGAKVVYTQMLLAADVVRDADTGLRETLGAHFSPDGDGAPVVAQIAGDCPVAMAHAARALAPFCAAVDINLGCPQDAAKAGHYGAWLCKCVPERAVMASARQCDNATMPSLQGAQGLATCVPDRTCRCIYRRSVLLQSAPPR